MDLVGKAKRVRIYVNEGDRVGHHPAQLAILEWLRSENAEGATLLRAVAGFGAGGQLHTAHVVDVAQNLPFIVEWIDASDVVERLLPRLKQMLPRGLITVDETEVVLHQSHPVRALPRLLTVGEVMSREIEAVAKATPLREVVERMLGKQYRAVPVVEAGVPVGIVTNGDLVRGGLAIRLELLQGLDRPALHQTLERLAASGKVAADVMTANPIVASAMMPLPRVAEVMARGRLKRLPVVDDQGKLVGMVSRLDLLRTVAGGVDRAAVEPRELGLAVDAPLARVMRRDVPAVTADTPLPEVFQSVVSTRLNRTLVVDADRKVLGLVTDAELLERVAPAHRQGALRALMHRLPFAHAREVIDQHASARVAADLMSRDVVTVPEDTLLSAAIARMLDGGHKVLAVTDAGGHLTGIVDRADLLHGLALPQGAPGSAR